MSSNRLWILGASDPEMAAIEGLLRECGERVAYAADERGERVHPGNAYRMAPLSGDLPWGGDIYLVECDAASPWPSDADGDPMLYRLVRRADAPGETGDIDDRSEYYLRVRRIDHHRPGDPGYGAPPAEFLAASSIGQVIAELSRLQRIPASWRRMRAGWAAPLTPQFGESGEEDWTGLPWLRAGRGGVDVWDVVYDAQTFVRPPARYVLIAAADHCLAAAYRGECPGVDPDALMRWRAESRSSGNPDLPEPESTHA